MGSWPDRMRQWKKRKKQLEIEADVQSMGLGGKNAELEALRQKPRSLELGRIKDLYAETYDAYLRGDYKSYIHRRRRTMAAIFEQWSRMSRNIDVDDDETTESIMASIMPTPSSYGSRRMSLDAKATKPLMTNPPVRHSLTFDGNSKQLARRHSSSLEGSKLL